MKTIFTLILILSDLIELVYDMGVFTRQHVLPSMVYLYCLIEQGFDTLTSQEYTLEYNTQRLGFG